MTLRFSGLVALLALPVLAAPTSAQPFLLDHFNFYDAGMPPPAVAGVQLTDQFGATTTTLGSAVAFLVPADKNDEGIRDPFGHLTCYSITDPGPPGPAVVATHQFGAHPLTLGAPSLLCVPTVKLIAPGTSLLDHYQCYPASGSPLGATALIVDQFQQQSIAILDPFLFCNPVDKNGEGIGNVVDHLTCYDYDPPGTPPGPVEITNQFFPDPIDVDLLVPHAVCLPSAKQVVTEVDHFAVYRAMGPDGPVVTIDDQFETQTTDLNLQNLFLVPANKNTEGILDLISHLSCHEIVDGDSPAREVQVSNQFGDQGLIVLQPRELCLPTEKLITPGVPSIDHFKCYEAVGPSLDVAIDWSDQFQGIGVTLREPFLHCNPADKNGEGVQNLHDHLVCYLADPPGLPVGPTDVVNQFNQGGPIDILEPFAVCVPSQKTFVPEPAIRIGLGAGALLLGALTWRRRAER